MKAIKNFMKKIIKSLEKEIDNLLNSYKNKFEQLDNKSFVTGHSAFSYFCRDFGLEQRSVEGYLQKENQAVKVKGISRLL